MAGAVRGRAGDGDPGAPASGPKTGSGQDPEGTSDALSGDEEFVCVDCDARQVHAMDKCPSCGGAVVAKHFLEESDYDPLIGRKIGGRFTVIARLGAGSMGAVYRARQDGMSREVALKVLKPERAFDAGSKARFEREARATSALTSPHTVTVYDFGEDETTSQGPLLYLAMERLEGESLGQRLKRSGRIPPKEAVKIAQQTLRSLSEAHEKGVVHRDLKPDNIYLHRVPTPHGLEETVKVLDFGIAKILQPDLKVDSLETQAGTVFGTPRYMSPEQAQSKPLDGRSDLYTIGLILFQMVTGRHCFPDEDAVVVMARHIQSLPPRPREVAPDAGISKKLEALILKTLSKDPKRRPQSALELHEELAAAILEDPGPPPAVAATLESAAVRIDAGASMPPTADASLEINTQSVRRRRTRAQMVAYGGAFCFILLGAIALGVRLARTGGSGGVIVEPTTEVKSTEDKPTTTSIPAATATTQQPTATIPPVVMTAAPSTTTTDTAKKTKPVSKWKPSAGSKDTADPTPTATATTAAPTTTATQKKSGYQKFE
jgi:serine/threonine-protein kinase